MEEKKLSDIEAWANQAIATYQADAAKGDPAYPNMAADVLELVRLHRALINHNEMQAAQLRLLNESKQEPCPQCLGSKNDPLDPEEPCSCCGGTGVV